MQNTPEALLLISIPEVMHKYNYMSNLVESVVF